MKHIYLFLFFIVTGTLVGNATTPDFHLYGFAGSNGGATGGNAATSIIDVYNADELMAAIGTKKSGGTTPRIIRVNGTIKGSDDIAIKECSNITIFGADENALIEQTPMIITSSSNVIIRNLKFTMTGKGGGLDLIEITTTSSNWCRNIWVDHCEFYNETPTVAGSNSSSVKDKYDGLLDIKKNSEYITISWCYFHDHYKAILVGYTAKDVVDRKITMHHNRFERINSRVPSYRGGTAHIYNNYFEGWIENGNSQGTVVHTREDCNLLVENNYFTKINKAVYWDPEDAEEGFASGTGNYFAPDVKSGFTARAATVPFVPPYSDVPQDDVMSIPELTLNYAGVGKITAYDDYGGQADDNSAPSVTITSPEADATYDAPADITLSATISDADGSISKVEIYSGATLITTLTEAPYSYTFPGLTVGNYSFTVKAYDDKNKFTSRSVSVTVNAPALTTGASLFGPSAPAGYFWFGEEAAVTNALFSDEILTGTAAFNATKNDADYTTHTGAIVLPSNGGTAIFKLPSCTVFKLYLVRTGSYAGNIYTSTDGETWGAAKASLSGSKGVLETDYSTLVASASPVYVKIENTSTGGLNIYGADIRLAANTETAVVSVQPAGMIVATSYYNLSGMRVQKPQRYTIYIREDVYDNQNIKRTKIIY
jgi:pectate lyase